MLTAEQQRLFDRVDAKAFSMGLHLVGDGNMYWAHAYRANGLDKLVMGCSFHAKDKDTDLMIVVGFHVPSGRKTVLETKLYSLDEFEKLDGEKLMTQAKAIQAQSEEIEALEAKLKSLKQTLNKQAKQVLKAK